MANTHGHGVYRSDEQYQRGKKPKVPDSAVAPEYPNMGETPDRPEPTRSQMTRRLMQRFHAQKVEAEEYRDREQDHSFRRTSPPGGPAG